jgi:uncharacterized protein YifN (PemK superfamily)
MFKYIASAGALVATTIISVAPLSAQASSTVQRGLLDAAVVAPANGDAESVQRWLRTDRVATVARNLGADVGDLGARVATLDATAMHDLAERARADEQNLAGGDSKVIISTTAIIIGLLILILITS